MVDSILIKDKSGQLKTVSLNMAPKISPVKTNTPYQPDGEKNNVPVMKETEPPVTAAVVNKPAEIKLNTIPVEKTAPAFYFNLDDEKEVEEFRGKELSNQQKKYKDSLAYLTENVLNDSQLKLNTEIEIRLKKLIDSRLRDVRTLRDTKDILVRATTEGGIGLDKDLAQKVLKLIEQGRIKMEEGLDKIVVEKETVKKEADSLPVQESVLINKIKPFATYIHPSYQPATINHLDGLRSKVVQPSVVVQDVNLPPQPRVRFSPFSALAPVPYSPFKRKYEVVGPVDELATFDLETFSSLAATPQEATQKIKNKINMLQDESFEKKAQGIRAWHSSAVYQFYLALGRESMESNQSIQNLILEKQGLHQPTLTYEQFEAIADLNEELSF